MTDDALTPDQIQQIRDRVAELMPQVRADLESYLKIGVTDFLLIIRGDNPKAIGEHLAAQLPRLRELS